MAAGLPRTERPGNPPMRAARTRCPPVALLRSHITFMFLFLFSVCVLLLQDLLQSCSRGGGGEWRTCAMRDDESRPVWI